MVAVDFLNHRVVRAKRFTLQIDLLFTAFFNNRAGSGTKGDPTQHHIKTRFCHRHRFGLFYLRGDRLIFAKPVLLAD